MMSGLTPLFDQRHGRLRIAGDNRLDHGSPISRVAAHKQPGLRFMRVEKQRHSMRQLSLMNRSQRLFRVTRAASIVGRNGQQEQHTSRVAR